MGKIFHLLTWAHLGGFLGSNHPQLPVIHICDKSLKMHKIMSKINEKPSP